MINREKNILIKYLISLESEAMYPQTRLMGDLSSELFSNKSQMKKLQNIAFSCNKTVDILDYIKNQTGKDEKKNNWAQKDYGKKLIENLTALARRRDQLVKQLEEKNYVVEPGEKQKIYLSLCREFIRHMVAQYLYGREVQGKYD